MILEQQRAEPECKYVTFKLFRIARVGRVAKYILSIKSTKHRVGTLRKKVTLKPRVRKRRVQPRIQKPHLRQEKIRWSDGLTDAEMILVE